MTDRVSEQHQRDYDAGRIATTDGKPPAAFVAGAPGEVDPATGQHAQYWVLSDAERAKGFVRPVRDTYRHDRCGSITKMGSKLAETYARDPQFYGATFCCSCRGHFPVGADGEFTWDKSDERVGT